MLQRLARAEPQSGRAYSGSFTFVVFQQPPQSLTALRRACVLWGVAARRKEQHVALALVIPLVMKMLHILRQRMAERRFSKEDYPRAALLLDRAHPALRIGIQVG